MVPDAERWNHNIHYLPRLLTAVPPASRRALDVGCGEGMLTRMLRRQVPDVTGIDVDEASIALAEQQQVRGQHVTYVLGDLLQQPFAPASFDVVVAAAVLHHMDAEAGIGAMKRVLAPGGVLVVLGLARSRLPRDLAWEAAAVAANLWHRSRHEYWEQTAPTVWPPPLDHSELQRVARVLLPGVHYRRHLMWRYSLVWTKPST